MQQLGCESHSVTCVSCYVHVYGNKVIIIILNFKMVAVNTKTGIFQNRFTTDEPKLAYIHFTLYGSI